MCEGIESYVVEISDWLLGLAVVAIDTGILKYASCHEHECYDVAIVFYS